MTVLSVYSVPSRYISPIKRPIQREIYPNPGHGAGLIHTSPVQSSPGPTELGIGPIPVQNLLGLDWTGQVESLADTLPVFVVLSAAEPFSVDSSRCMPAHESVERNSQRIHACHRNGSLGPRLALESGAEVRATLHRPPSGPLLLTIPRRFV